jgi:hypothetical protein
LESFEQAKNVAYNVSGLKKRTVQTKEGKLTAIVLDESYDARAQPVVRTQLRKAGVRLAMVLNDALQ